MEHGRLRQVGTPEQVFRRPSSRFVAAFIGSVPMNLLDATATGATVRIGADTGPSPAPAQLGEGDQVVLGIRPEHATLSLEPADHTLRGTVAVIELLGTEYLVTVERPDQPLQVTTRQAPPLGVQAWVHIPAAEALLYDTDTGTLLAPEPTSPAAGLEAKPAA
jgi:multiple sugar transport system ATP-binding protein